MAVNNPYFLYQPGELNRLAFENDRHHQLGDERQAPRSKIVAGTIISSWPGVHCYQVAVDGLSGLFTCGMISRSSLDPLSAAADCQTLLPLSRVLVLLFDWDVYGWIMGVLPSEASNSVCQSPDFFVPLAGTGLRVDPAYTICLGRPEHGLTNFNAGRAGDLLPGEYGLIGSLGVGLMVSQLMASLRGSDLSRIDVSYVDNMIRVFAHNLELFTSGSERQAFEDEGEISDVIRRVLYPWEALGLSVPTGGAFKDGDFKWDESDTQGGQEPARERQTGVWRDQEMYGYLGDLYRRVVSAPIRLTGLPVQLAGEMERPETDVGLFEQVIGSDGSFTLRSAKRIIVAKTCLIPVPTQRRDPRDPSGDSPHAGNYRSSGHFGTGGKSHEREEYPEPEEKYANSRHVRVLDLHAYVSNWYSMVGLTRHEQDWYVPQARDVSLGSLSSSELHTLTGANMGFQLPVPQKTRVRIDHRTTVDYYQSIATQVFDDDGSIIQTDGYGSQIIMSGGNIRFTCPGQIFLESGGSVIAMAGRDLVMRSGRSVDITAAKRDVRIKAEKNFHALAGNSGQGGIFMESRADNEAMLFEGVRGEDVRSSGITFKAENSRVSLVGGKGVYVRSEPDGAIVLDSGKGKGDLTIAARQMVTSLQTNLIINIGSTLESLTSPGGGASNVSHVFNALQTYVDTPIAVNGRLLALGSIAADGAVVASGGIAGSSAPIVGKTPDEFNDQLADTRTQLDQAKTAIRDSLRTAATSLYSDQQSIASDAFLRSLTFSLRTEEQYGLADDPSFVVYESIWQQRLRTARAGALWSEPAVYVTGQERTYPWPGTNNWLEKPTFKTLDPQFYDLENGRPKDRPYDNPEKPTTKPMAFKDGYRLPAENI